jgi:hypothetical protein
VKSFSGIGMEHRLGDAFAVAQVNKNDAAEIAPPVHPPHEQRALTRVGSAQLPAGVRSAKVAQKIQLCCFHVYLIR